MSEEILEGYCKDKQPEKIPLPFFGFGGKLVLTIYWFIYKNFFFRGEESYKNTIKQLDTPWKVQSWLYANILYTSDKKPIDEWQPAERTYDRGRGDCEDWAVFSNECLKDKYEGYFLCMYNNKSGHCDYCVKTGKDKYTSIGTYGLMYHKGSWEKIVPDWSGYEFWERIVVKNEKLSNIKVIFRNWKI